MADNEETKKVDETTATPEDKEKEGGGHPETVSWTQYVGLKEKFNKTEAGLTTKVETLEGQLKEAVSTEEHGKIKVELDETKAKLQESSTKLTETLEKSLSEKRDVLVKKGNISEEEAKGMSEEQVNGAIKVLGSFKPGADMGAGGGGAGSLVGKSPLTLAAMGYEKK